MMPNTLYMEHCVFFKLIIQLVVFWVVKESTMADRGCRHCTAGEMEVSNVFEERKLVLRTPELHKEQCEEMYSADSHT